MPTTKRPKRNKPSAAPPPRLPHGYRTSIRAHHRIIARDVTAATRQAQSDLDRLAACAVGAWDAAVEITRQSRAQAPLPAAVFVAYLRLNVFLERLDALPNVAELWARWPTTPGVTFSWKGGESALHVAFQFARMIRAAGGFLGNVRTDRQWARVCVQPPEPNIVQWCEAALSELRTRTLPMPWPMWEIRRDADAHLSLIRHEWERASTPKSVGNAAGAELIGFRPELGKAQNLVLQILQGLPAGTKLMGGQIVEELKSRGYPITEPGLRRWVLTKAFREHGVRNTPKQGYYYDCRFDLYAATRPA